MVTIATRLCGCMGGFPLLVPATVAPVDTLKLA
jgi:hypothetical protein